MFVSPAFSTPTRSMTSPQASPFTPTNFNKVTLSDSSAQQQRQGVSSPTLEALQRGVQVLFEEINDSQLLGYMPFFGEDFNVSLRLRHMDSMTTTLQGLRDLLDGYFKFLNNDGRGIDAIPNYSLLRFYEEWISTERDLEPADLNDPFLQLIEEREKPTFNSLALAQRFKDLSCNVNAVLTHLTEREKTLRNSAYHNNQVSRQAILKAIYATG